MRLPLCTPVQNVLLRTQCDCTFPLNMVTSLTVWVKLLMLVWGSMYHTDPLSKFSVSFLSRYESHRKWLESAPVEFFIPNGRMLHSQGLFQLHTHLANSYQ